MSISIGATISDELNESLTRLAIQLDRSKRYIVNKALEKFIAEELKDDCDFTLDEIKQKTQELEKFLINDPCKAHEEQGANKPWPATYYYDENGKAQRAED